MQWLLVPTTTTVTVKSTPHGRQNTVMSNPDPNKGTPLTDLNPLGRYFYSGSPRQGIVFAAPNTKEMQKDVFPPFVHQGRRFATDQEIAESTQSQIPSYPVQEPEPRQPARTGTIVTATTTASRSTNSKAYSRCRARNGNGARDRDYRRCRPGNRATHAPPAAGAIENVGESGRQEPPISSLAPGAPCTSATPAHEHRARRVRSRICPRSYAIMVDELVDELPALGRPHARPSAYVMGGPLGKETRAPGRAAHRRAATPNRKLCGIVRALP